MMKVTLKEISLDETISFRTFYSRVPILIYDEWDDESLHIGFFHQDILAGVLRVTSVKGGKLPFSLTFPRVDIMRDDVEIGRLLVAHPYRRTRVVREILDRCDQWLTTQRDQFHRVYMNVITGGALKPGRYLDYGFRTTGLYAPFRGRPKGCLLLVRDMRSGQ